MLLWDRVGPAWVSAVGRPRDLTVAIEVGMRSRTERFSAEKLATLRKQKDISQRDLAKAAAISQAQVAELERGKRQPAVDVAERIAAVLGVGIGELFQS